jgi:hypothetical protein
VLGGFLVPDQVPATEVTGAGLVEVLERVMDKGIVIDAWTRVGQSGRAAVLAYQA